MGLGESSQSNMENALFVSSPNGQLAPIIVYTQTYTEITNEIIVNQFITMFHLHPFTSLFSTITGMKGKNTSLLFLERKMYP